MKHPLIAAISIVALMGAGCAFPGMKTSTEPTVPVVAPEAQAPDAAAPVPEQDAAQNPAVKKPAPAPKPVTQAVVIGESAFAPQVLVIKAGETVVWTNKSTKSHTVSSGGGTLLLNSGNIAPGKTFSHTFESPGSYIYYCGIHESMTGTIIVR